MDRAPTEALTNLLNHTFFFFFFFVKRVGGQALGETVQPRKLQCSSALWDISVLKEQGELTQSNCRKQAMSQPKSHMERARKERRVRERGGGDKKHRYQRIKKKKKSNEV